MTEIVHLDVAHGVATITLDSEHNRNALSRQLMTELRDHFGTVERTPDLRAVLLRSSGRVFCSGADLSEAASGGMVEGAQALADLQRLIATVPVPVVVELAGPVRAGGLGLVGAADVVVAAESVTFALTEVRLALAAAVISLSLLERMDSRVAADLFLTGRTFDAAEARRAGIVTHVAPDEGLADAVESVLGDLRLAHPQGLRETKLLLNRSLVERIDTLRDEVTEQSSRLFGSDEAREAMIAFLNRKR